MERLTEYRSDIKRMAVRDGISTRAVIDRLAAYEDTGAVPAELSELQEEAYDLGYQSCLNYKGLKWPEAKELQRYRETGLDPEHAAMWEKNRRNGVTIGRMAEFLEAEADGRVVLLPCKPGEYWRDHEGDRVRIESVSFCKTRSHVGTTDMVTYSYEDEEDEFAVNWTYFRGNFTREES